MSKMFSLTEVHFIVEPKETDCGADGEITSLKVWKFKDFASALDHIDGIIHNSIRELCMENEKDETGREIADGITDEEILPDGEIDDENYYASWKYYQDSGYNIKWTLKEFDIIPRKK